MGEETGRREMNGRKSRDFAGGLSCPPRIRLKFRPTHTQAAIGEDHDGKNHMGMKLFDVLPYHMGNAGDLLKHGALAELVRWRCGLPGMRGRKFRFFDLFGGRPWEDDAQSEVLWRVHSLADTALLAAQPEISQGRYYGSGHLVWQAAENAGADNIAVFASDSHKGRDFELRNSGLTPVAEAMPGAVAPVLPGGHAPPYDAYACLRHWAERARLPGDLALVDPFGNFLPRKSGVVIPQVAAASKKAPVVLFALNLEPTNKVGERFHASLKAHLPHALKMTCPPVAKTGVKGEGKYHADVVLSVPPGLLKTGGLQERLSDFAEKLAGVLGLSGEQAEMLKPKVIGQA